MNDWAVSLVGYSGLILNWARIELRNMDHRSKKLMTMHKAFQPRDDIDVSRKERGRGLESIEKWLLLCLDPTGQ